MCLDHLSRPRLASGAIGKRTRGPDTLEYLAGQVVRIPLETIRDDRGWLSPIEFGFRNFKPVRAFIVSAPNGVARGGHAHAKCRQVFMLVAGHIDIEISDGTISEHVTITPDNRALLIEAKIWTRQIFRGDNSSMVVFCDIPFEPDEYIQSRLELAAES